MIIGAVVEYVWNDEPDDEITGYISFGEYVEELSCDTYGMHDDAIFYYSSLEELSVGLEEDWTLIRVVKYAITDDSLLKETING